VRKQDNAAYKEAGDEGCEDALGREARHQVEKLFCAVNARVCIMIFSQF
jgi:hypothetical protein